MDNKMQETIRETISRIPRQDVYEIVSILAPLERELDIIVTNYYLILPYVDTEGTPVPLENIHCVIKSDTHVCILCHNNVIHCINLQTRKHELILPGENKPSFFELFLMMCRSYLDSLKR